MQTPKTAAQLEIQIWPIDLLVLYARNPRKNDAVVDRMCSSIREFGFKIPVLARSDGERGTLSLCADPVQRDGWSALARHPLDGARLGRIGTERRSSGRFRPLAA